jgi:hypothetical protein
VERVEVRGRQKDAPWIQGGKPFTTEEDGYTIHAGVWLDGKDAPDGWGREKLEKVCRYLLRPAFSEERLSRRADGKIEVGLRKPRGDGGTSVVLELLEKLAALVPAPRSHVVRYHGALGPSHEWRAAVLPPPPEEDSAECRPRPEIEPWDDEEEDRPVREGSRRRRKPTDWATLIRRSLKLDALSCPKCGDRMKMISTITEPGLVRRMLRSMGWSAEIPPRGPPRSYPSGEFEFVH